MAPEDMSRRDFLSHVFWTVVAAILATLAYPLVGYSISPAIRKQEEHIIDFGSVRGFTKDSPQNVEVSFRKTDAWLNITQKSNVWVVYKGGSEFVVFSPKCTHLGCAYHWDDSVRRFICPCHGGQFDINGKVLAGPPPRPLDRLPHMVKNGNLFVGEF